MTSAPRYPPLETAFADPGWIGLALPGAFLIAFGAWAIYDVSTASSVDVGGMLNGIVFLFGVACAWLGLGLLAGGLAVRAGR